MTPADLTLGVGDPRMARAALDLVLPNVAVSNLFAVFVAVAAVAMDVADNNLRGKK